MARFGGRTERVERRTIDGITLEYEDSGVGEPVVFIHGALIADAFRPLLSEGGLADRYRLISYHRRGYGGSSRTRGPLSLAEQSGDCRRLLSHLGVRRTHVVGHSLGGAIGLQLALDAPRLVNTLSVLEAGLMVGESAPLYREGLVRGMQRYREAGGRAAVDEFLRVRLPAYREDLERVLPGAFEQAVADAATCFEAELPVVLDWAIRRGRGATDHAARPRRARREERRPSPAFRRDPPVAAGLAAERRGRGRP